MSAVSPRRDSLAWTFAPFATRTFIAPTLPVRAAVMSTVSPLGSAAFASAPARSSVSMSAASPFTAARLRGVTP